jgi:hypothetical protein
MNPGWGGGRDLYEEARRLTLDIVLRVTFGARIERSDELSDVIGEFITQTVNVANEVPPWWAVGASLSYRKVQRSLVSPLAQRRTQVQRGPLETHAPLACGIGTTFQ